MLQMERNTYILSELATHGVVTVKQVAHDLGISESTIRRDLIDLELAGQLKRVHGGAVLGDGQRIYTDTQEIKIMERFGMNKEVKIAICKKVAAMIEDHQSVFIDGGSSLAYLADELANRNVKIVTNNELFIKRLNGAKAEVFYLGGNYLDKYRMTMGPTTLKYLSRFNFDASFISCTGISFDNNMSYTAELATTEVKQQAIKQSLHSYLVLDESKIEMIGFCNVMALSDFTGVLCNQVEDIETSLENMIWI